MYIECTHTARAFYLASGGEVPADSEHRPPEGASDAEIVHQHGNDDAPHVVDLRANHVIA